jgi:tetratricopeptide (TPR) repeat protein
MTRTVLGILVTAALAVRPAPAAAQAQQGTGGDPLLDMQSIARALGVSCSHCHVQGDFKSDANPKKVVARQMIAMTRELNATIQTATGKTAAQAAKMHCVNCHRGMTVPRTLNETLSATIAEKGAEAAVEQYRELRKKFYAKDTYDFSENELLAFLGRVADARPDAAIPLLQAHLEFNPKSATSYIVLSRAYQRKRDNPTAIEMLKKALEIEPENGLAQGYLYQLQPRQR